MEVLQLEGSAGQELLEELSALDKACVGAEGWSAESFRSEAVRENGIVLYIPENGRPVALLCGYTAMGEANITSVAVAESCRRRGLARALMERFLALLPGGTRNVFLEVREYNDPAIALYRSFGFEMVGLRKNFYREPLENAIVMAKELPAEELRLAEVSPRLAEQITQIAAEFPVGEMTATPDPDLIPGLDRLEEFSGVEEWIDFLRSMNGKIRCYVTVRESDGAAVGAVCIRPELHDDDEDLDFASNIGYCIRPSMQGRGYGQAQLRLALEKSRELGLKRVRLICRDTNIPSRRLILSCGGVYIDTLHGDISGMDVERYDIPL
ncbi:MAG: ribosomal protein S18-alanine N-acetyltransferase [Ruminococcus sp.]|nr:ribosomal protein S18-alanine N-acetyltransferase [Ruminococcus sp.]